MEQANGPNLEAVVNALLGARDAMLRIRTNMRQMGEAAGIPVGFSSLLRASVFFIKTIIKCEGLRNCPKAGSLINV